MRSDLQAQEAAGRGAEAAFGGPVMGLVPRGRVVYPVYRMQTLGFRRPNQVREAVYRHLRDLLLSGRFAPGERLSEPLLAQDLGVSRTPVREA